jgi:DNA-binding response OmpR family regulator
MKILVAEDDKVSRLVLTTGLHKLGYDSIDAEDGQEAWALYRKGGVHLVITDWMMPKIDGLELCRKIRATQEMKYTYIIMLTALGGKESFLEGMNAGADDFITKPFDIDQLSARLRVAERILKLQDEVRQLEGLLPICSYCKKIRTSANSWEPIEEFIMHQTDASFSHGICPECVDKHVRPQINELRQRRDKTGARME